MAATVTAFYTFSPGTKAKSSEVNTNFSQYRGTIIPVDPTLAAGASLSYDLGSTEYWWRSVYAQSANLRGQTTTSQLTISNDTTTAEWNFAINGTEAARLSANGFLRYLTIASGGTSWGHVAATSGATDVAFSTITVSRTSGSKFIYKVVPGNQAAAAGGCIQIYGLTATVTDLRIIVYLMRNGTVTMGSFIFGSVVEYWSTASATTTHSRICVGSFEFIDWSPTSGSSNTYHLMSRCLWAGATSTHIGVDFNCMAIGEVLYK